jgi:hypothetical protein
VQRGRPPRRSCGYSLYPYSFHSVEGSIADPVDNGESLLELRRRCRALCQQNGGRFPHDATRNECLQMLEAQRRYQAAFRTKGRRLPPEATYADCLSALARRLGVPTGKCDPKADPVTSWYSGPWNRLSDSVGERLITVQPEFWTLMGTSNPGRPFGARNKQSRRPKRRRECVAIVRKKS